MKTIPRVLIALISFSILTLSSFAQHSCCINPSTKVIAMLSNDESFKASHLSPLPFNYVSPAGQMVFFKAADGKIASAFEIKAKSSTQNYLFVFQEWWGLNDYIKQ